jgi:hypothetical protein
MNVAQKHTEAIYLQPVSLPLPSPASSFSAPPFKTVNVLLLRQLAAEEKKNVERPGEQKKNVTNWINCGEGLLFMCHFFSAQSESLERDIFYPRSSPFYSAVIKSSGHLTKWHMMSGHV